MRKLAISILISAAVSVCLYGQTNTQLYVITGLSYQTAKVASSVFQVDQQKQLISTVLNIADKTKGTGFIRLDHDRRVIAVGTPPLATNQVVLVSMDSPTQSVSLPLTYAGSLDAKGELQTFLDEAVFVDKPGSTLPVVAMITGELNQPTRLSELVLRPGAQERIAGTASLPDWSDYQYIHSEGEWEPGDVYPLSVWGTVDDAGRMIYRNSVDMGPAPPNAKKGAPWHLVASNDAITVLGGGGKLGNANSNSMGNIMLWIYTKATQTWQTATFTGGGSSVRVFGSWLAVDTAESKREVKNGAAVVDPLRERESPGRVLRLRTNGLFVDSQFYFPGEVVLYNTQSGKKYTITTGQGDTEVLLIDGTTVYYRVNDTLYRADISSLDSPVSVLEDDATVPFVHWAFMGPAISQ